MKNKIGALLLVALATSIGASGCKGGAASSGSGGGGTKALQTEEQKTLYALGLLMGRSLTMFKFKEADLDYVKMGIQDMALGNKALVELSVYGPKVQEMARARSQAASEATKGDAEKEKVKGKQFAEKMGKEAGAEVLPSGLVFIPMKPGTGDSPKATDKVKVHYEGKLINGTIFDSSVKRGQPAEFPLNGVIPCWTEGVQLMKVGGKSRLVCPSGIAYGDNGSPPKIKPGATLSFEVELLEIMKPAAAPAAQAAPAAPPVKK